MKTRDFIYIAVIIVMGFFLYNSACSRGEGDKVEVTTDEKHGEFEAKEPEHTQIDTVRVPEYLPGKPVRVQDPLNEKLLAENDSLRQAFKAAPDTIRIPMYEQAITLNDFAETFDDSLLTINIAGKVRGQVKSIKPTYTIKPTKVTATVKTYRVLAGGKLETTQTLEAVRYNANLHYLAPNGWMYTASLGDHGYFGCGLSATIFKRTKTTKSK